MIAKAALSGLEGEVADDQRGTLYRFNESGAFDGAVYVATGYIDNLAVDNFGLNWVMDRRSKAYYLVSPSGRLLASLTATGSMPRGDRARRLRRPLAVL